jgi:hypothetical protein
MSRPQVRSAAGRITSIEKSNDLIGNRTRGMGWATSWHTYAYMGEPQCVWCGMDSTDSRYDPALTVVNTVMNIWVMNTKEILLWCGQDSSGSG